MILIDANLLIYAHASTLPQHPMAREWLDQQLTELDAVGFPWESIMAFVRVMTNPRILQRPISIADAWRQAEEWLTAEPAWIPQATSRQQRLFGELLTLPGLRANDVPDAFLAALAIDHGLLLCSTDSGFARFPRLRWTNPLTG